MVYYIGMDGDLLHEGANDAHASSSLPLPGGEGTGREREPKNKIHAGIASLEPGAYAVGVSGGADSVALLLLLCERSDLSLRVVHLNHQTRGHASDSDATFVAELSDRLGIPWTVAGRDEIERGMKDLPANPSSRYRQVRLELFARVVRENSLKGVALAHHADDQAETVLQRLARGSGMRGLAGIRPVQEMGGLTLFRPLLDVTRKQLRKYLAAKDQTWREDASNDSDQYGRNRARKILAASPELVSSLLELGRAASDYQDWARECAPEFDVEFDASALSRLPLPLARESACRWLASVGVAPEELTLPVLDRLIEMSRDVAGSPRQQFPSGKIVWRRGGRLGAK